MDSYVVSVKVTKVFIKSLKGMEPAPGSALGRFSRGEVKVNCQVDINGSMGEKVYSVLPRRPLPNDKNYYEVEYDGGEIEIEEDDQLIFRRTIQENDDITIWFYPEEIDPQSPSELIGMYSRTFRVSPGLWGGEYTPDDDDRAPDPEDRNNIKVWYNISVRRIRKPPGWWLSHTHKGCDKTLFVESADGTNRRVRKGEMKVIPVEWHEDIIWYCGSVRERNRKEISGPEGTNELVVINRQNDDNVFFGFRHRNRPFQRRIDLVGDVHSHQRHNIVLDVGGHNVVVKVHAFFTDYLIVQEVGCTVEISDYIATSISISNFYRGVQPEFSENDSRTWGFGERHVTLKKTIWPGEVRGGDIYEVRSNAKIHVAGYELNFSVYDVR